MSTLRHHDDYTYTHSVNVSILAICLGHYIGLDKNALETLGICGLFHDLGKVDIPLKILNKRESVYACIIEGKRYDIGNKMDYLRTIVEFGLKRKEFKEPFIDFLKDIIK
jgi:HD superfamily phosphodiesterase